MIKPAELRERLGQCIGTQNYWRVYKEFVLTDGAKLFCELAEAYWLASDLFFMTLSLVKKYPFIGVTLAIKDQQADLTLTDGDEKVILKQHYPYTDCPEGEWNFFLITENGKNVLMLTSEY